MENKKKRQAFEVVSHEKRYPVYGYRWVVLASFSFILLANGVAVNFYSAITKLMAEAYDCHLSVILLAMIMKNITFIPGAFWFANYLIGSVGIFASLFVGTLFVLMCVWMRICLNYSILFLFASDIISGLAQPTLLNLPPKISNCWFSIEERPIATIIGGISSPIGQALGFALPPLFLPTSVNTVQERIYFQERFRNLAFYFAIIATTVLLVCIIIFREKPPRPPTKTASEKGKENVFAGLKTLWQNKNFVLFICCYVTHSMARNTFNISLAPIVASFQYDALDAGLMGMLCIGFGIVSSYLMGLYLSNARKYKLTSISLTSGSVLSLSVVLGALYSRNKFFLLMSAALQGVASTPMLPFGLEYGCELGYPIGESTITVIIISLEMVFALVPIIVIGLVLDEISTTRGCLSVVGIILLFAISFTFSLFVKENLIRMEYDLHSRNKITIKRTSFAKETELLGG